MIDKFDRIKLGHFPTPIEYLNNITLPHNFKVITPVNEDELNKFLINKKKYFLNFLFTKSKRKSKRKSENVRNTKPKYKFSVGNLSA